MTTSSPAAEASLENMYRIFSVPEGLDSTLGAIDQEISRNLSGFLKDNVVASDSNLEQIEKDFAVAEIPEKPQFVSDYSQFALEKLVAQSVHTASPSFVGHMTTPLPYFMLPLSRIMVALNQNPVKIETSKAFTSMERQVLAMMHHLVYERPAHLYSETMHHSEMALGAFCSGGTIANMTALWVARNRSLPANDNFGGIASEGLAAGLSSIDCSRLVIVASQRCHYSVAKAADVLGLGRSNMISVPTDDKYRVDVRALKQTCDQLSSDGAKIMAIVGAAGTTEMGSVDPLQDLAEIAQDHKTQFHVDAAWGGPTLFSESHRNLFEGIAAADSVTIDAHKQMYVPMGAGMVLFKDPEGLSAIQHHAEYILRAGSKDLGRHTLEGSRPAMALLVHAALHIIGRKGYELLIDQNFERAQLFAKMISEHPDFELLVSPQLNILNYRYAPAKVQSLLASANRNEANRINQILDQATELLQKKQRSAGKTFVSRTRYQNQLYNQQSLSVFRAVLANPMTTTETLTDVLQDQVSLAKSRDVQILLDKIT